MGTNNKRCFVVMGFGTKTDLATGRKLNLGKSYLALIKPAVERKGYECVRADEIRHSGTIDVPMYQQLLTADIVIADISTANPNALYELGVRHALRPRTTIVIAESQLCYPFDLNHTLITKYDHLGEHIDYFEVMKFQDKLIQLIEKVETGTEADSPVYTFLHGLVPPSLEQKTAALAQQIEDTLSEVPQAPPAPAVSSAEPESQSLAVIIKQAEEAIRTKEFSQAKKLFSQALEVSKCKKGTAIPDNNTYLIQRLAFATYKAKEPNERKALEEAMRLLHLIDLEHTNDSETVTLAGAVEKLLFMIGDGEHHIEKAILYFQRGFFLLHNEYNGINLAFLLNCRANSSLSSTQEEKIADAVWANRVRKSVVDICDRQIKDLEKREKAVATQLQRLSDAGLTTSQEEDTTYRKFWLLVNKAEAFYGLRDLKAYETAKKAAYKLPHENWMKKSFEDQVQQLGKMLEEFDVLLQARIPLSEPGKKTAAKKSSTGKAASPVSRKSKSPIK